MFKRYVYTCPDVIHARRVQKQVAYTSFGVQTLFWGGLWLAAQSNKSKSEPTFDDLIAE